MTVKEPLEVSATEMAKDYSSLLNSQTLSDFKFKVDGVDFHVHKVILAGEPNVRSFPDLLNFISYVARSPVFMKMFTGDFQESKLDKGAISDISHKAFLDFLRFLYTNSVDDLKSYVLELLSISDLYEVEGLKKMCESQLMSGLNEENAPDIFQYAHRYRCDNKLKVTAFALIKKYEYTRYVFVNFISFYFSKDHSRGTTLTYLMSFLKYQKLFKRQLRPGSSWKTY